MSHTFYKLGPQCLSTTWAIYPFTRTHASVISLTPPLRSHFPGNNVSSCPWLWWLFCLINATSGHLEKEAGAGEERKEKERGIMIRECVSVRDIAVGTSRLLELHIFTTLEQSTAIISITDINRWSLEGSSHSHTQGHPAKRQQNWDPMWTHRSCAYPLIYDLSEYPFCFCLAPKTFYWGPTSPVGPR